MKYFKNKLGTLLGVSNEDVISQMEAHPETYTPCDKDGKAEKAEAKTGKKVEAEAEPEAKAEVKKEAKAKE